jgi:hypothetical protein
MLFEACVQNDVSENAGQTAFAHRHRCGSITSHFRPLHLEQKNVDRIGPQYYSAAPDFSGKQASLIDENERDAARKRPGG